MLISFPVSLHLSSKRHKCDQEHHNTNVRNMSRHSISERVRTKINAFCAQTAYVPQIIVSKTKLYGQGIRSIEGTFKTTSEIIRELLKSIGTTLWACRWEWQVCLITS